MLYLSHLLQKKLFFEGKPYAKIIDVGITDAQKSPVVTTLRIKRGNEKQLVNFNDISLENNLFVLKTREYKSLGNNPKNFYLGESLLDKQVIDITGKRLVRVNDVLMKQNGTLSIVGIDVSFAGILRRLGINTGNVFKTVIIPWSFIGAFDYQTGDVHIRLGSSSFNSLHPSEIAEILEDAGTKERLGVIDSLDSEKAADVLEETDTDVQQSILEELSHTQLKKIVQKMSLSELADALPQVSDETKEEIFSYLGPEKTKGVTTLLKFDHDTAGGLMDVNVPVVFEGESMKDVKEVFEQSHQKEGVVLVDKDLRLIGVIDIKDLAFASEEKPIGKIKKEVTGVLPDTSFNKLLRLFAEYNLRLLPVVTKEQKVIGVLPIDNVLAHLYEEEEHEAD